MNYEFRLKHVWPSAVAFVSGANIFAGTLSNTFIGIIGLILCVWIIYENIKEEKYNAKRN